MKNIDFSVVTTCLNERETFEIWKRDILDQTRQPSEIVIVDAYSSDGTAEMLYKWALDDKRIRVIQEKGSPAHGRNTAIKNTKYEILLSTDMGVRLSHNWCEELVVPFEKDHEIDVVAGNSSIDISTITIPIAWAEYYIEKSSPLFIGPGMIPGNRSTAYKKSVWIELGGLPEELSFAADDSLFFRQVIQAGKKFAYAPNAMTFWSRPNMSRLFYKELFIYGKGDGEALIKTPQIVKIYKMGIFPKFLVPVANGIWNVLRNRKVKPMFKAVSEGNIKASGLGPVLAFQRGYHEAKGDLTGLQQGDEKCRAAGPNI